MLLRIGFLVFTLISVVFAQVKQEKPAGTLDDFLKSIPVTEGSIETISRAIEQGDDKIKTRSIAAIAGMSPTPEKAYKLLKEYINYGTFTTKASEQANQDITWEIRAHCAVGLKNVQGKDEEISRVLRKELRKEPVLFVKKAIVYTMGERKDVTSIPAIVTLMEIETDDSFLMECIHALAKMESKEAYLPLLKIYNGSHLQITKDQALTALQKIKWD